MFALDTNTVIYILKGQGDAGCRLAQTDLSEVSIPAVVAYELEFGTLCAENPNKRRRELHRLFDVMNILPFDHSSAERAASLRLGLEKAGKKIGPLDTLIAGTALAHNAILISHNVGEFSRVPGLRLDDWF